MQQALSVMRILALVVVALLAAGCAGQTTGQSSSATEDDAGFQAPSSALRTTASADKASYTIKPGTTDSELQSGLGMTIAGLLERHDGQDVQVRVAYLYQLTADSEADSTVTEPVLFSPTRPAGAALAAEIARDTSLWIADRQINSGDVVVTVSVPRNVDSAPID